MTDFNTLLDKLEECVDKVGKALNVNEEEFEDQFKPINKEEHPEQFKSMERKRYLSKIQDKIRDYVEQAFEDAVAKVAEDTAEILLDKYAAMGKAVRLPNKRGEIPEEDETIIWDTIIDRCEHWKRSKWEF